MDTNTTIALILIGVVIVVFVYALYYSQSRRKPKTTVYPEFKPVATKVEVPKMSVVEESIPKPQIETKVAETPKVEEVVISSPDTIIQGTVVEATKVTEPIPPEEAIKEPIKLVVPNLPEEAKTEPEKSQGIKKRKPAVKSKDHGAKISEIEGIGMKNAEKLNKVDINTTSELLKVGATPHGRRELSEKTGISHTLILEWVNLSDLFRIKGIGEEYSDLLEEAGVDTVVELSHRNAEHLHSKILEVNAAKKLVRRPPSLARVETWIEEAKSLPRVVEY